MQRLNITCLSTRIVASFGVAVLILLAYAASINEMTNRRAATASSNAVAADKVELHSLASPSTEAAPRVTSIKISDVPLSGTERFSEAGLPGIRGERSIRGDFWAIIYALAFAAVAAGSLWYRSRKAHLRRVTAGTQAKTDSKNIFDEFNPASYDAVRLSEYLNGVGNPVYAVDGSYVIRFANTAALDAAAGTFKEIVGEKKCYDLFTLPVCRTPDCPVSQALNHDQKVVGESTAKLKGALVPVLLHASPAADTSGNAIIGVEILTDIEELNNSSERIEDQRLYLSNNVDLLLRLMERLTGGELTVSLSAADNDGIGTLFEVFDESVVKIRQLIEQAVMVARESAKTSFRMNDSAMRVSPGTLEPSPEADEVAAMIEELTMVRDNSGSTLNAAGAASENANTGRNGEGIDRVAFAGMKIIAQAAGDSSKATARFGILRSQIREAVTVIEELADRTNLLALNAAIEAARADEDGTGFAAIADDVSKLAIQTSRATKQISSMITDIQNGASARLSSRVGSVSRVSSGFGDGIGELAGTAGNLDALTARLQNLTMELNTENTQGVTVDTEG